jgi:4'-phosphopantetheinyl transferase EntD
MPADPAASIPPIDSQRIAALFPFTVGAAEMRDAAPTSQLYPAELQHLGNALPQRRGEFAAGRSCARRALAAFGVLPCSLPKLADGSPLWPRGFTGSISHTHGFCGAVAARTADALAAGLDLETLAPLETEFVAEICTPQERAQVESLPAAAAARLAMLLFSAKEAFYKCQHPLTHHWLDFQDVDLQAHADGRIELIRMAAPAMPVRFAGRYGFDSAHVLTGFWAVADGD